MTTRKWVFARRSVQLAVIGLIASPLAGLGVFRGTLAAGDLLGLPLADPLAALQVVLATGVVVPAFLTSAAGVLLFYFLLGGRTFCGWVCPVYLLTELGDKLRQQIGTGGRTLPLVTKNWMLMAMAVVTLLTGLPLFEIVSPIGMTGRAIVFGGWPALLCLGGLVLLEVALAGRIWCRSLCPLGGLYALVGRFAPLRLRYYPARCTACGECSRVCPVEEVLAPALEHGAARICAGDCTRCGDCIDSCATNALTMGYGYSDRPRR